jgi:hypothetical protein
MRHFANSVVGRLLMSGAFNIHHLSVQDQTKLVNRLGNLVRSI